jgi:hypothetical protein
MNYLMELCDKEDDIIQDVPEHLFPIILGDSLWHTTCSKLENISNSHYRNRAIVLIRYHLVAKKEHRGQGE